MIELNIHVVAAAIKEPIKDWPGNCFAIASKMVHCGLIDGEAVYGSYLGKINKRSMFFGKPIVHHGWIVSGEKIIDPTRWVFTCQKPFVWSGRVDNLDYDRGSNVTREKLRKACGKSSVPPFCFEERSFEYDPDSIAGKAISDMIRRNNGIVCFSELIWIANASPKAIGIATPEIYRWLQSVGMVAAIPIDNRRQFLKS